MKKTTRQGTQRPQQAEERITRFYFVFLFSSPSRLKARSLLCPTTAAACSEGNSLCWEGCSPGPTRSLTAAAARCTSSIRTSPSGTSLSLRGKARPHAQGRLGEKIHTVTKVVRPFHLLSSFPLCVPSHSACVMQERKIYVFGGWDMPVCYNDMYTLDLGEHSRHRKSRLAHL